LSTAKQISILGVPQDYGAGRRGVDMGASAIRVANLNVRLEQLGYEVNDLGNLSVEQPEQARRQGSKAHHLEQIADNCRRAARTIARGTAFPLTLGGDHSIAAGTVAGITKRFGRQKLGLLWIDAHGDFNTPESSPSGNVHGMPLAAIAGLGVRELTHLRGVSPMVAPEKIVLVGIRDIDAGEARNIRQAGVTAFTMREIDERGMRAVMAEALTIVTSGTAGFHLSLDMDALDPEYAPGVGTPVMGGLSYREAHLAMEMIHDKHALVSMDVVEVNPVLDIANKTAALAVELILSAMGKKII
jgi:arginase